VVPQRLRPPPAGCDHDCSSPQRPTAGLLAPTWTGWNRPSRRITSPDGSRAAPRSTRLDLEVYPGEVLALLGPNGAGKTTTIRLLNGVLTPDEGSRRCSGSIRRGDGDDVRRRTGVLTENAGLDDRLTARENLEASARIRGLRAPTPAPASRAARAVRRWPTAPTHRPGRIDRAAQASGADPGPAARPRGAVPRRAHLGARSGRDPRRGEPDRGARRRARPHHRAVHPLPRRGRTTGRPHGGAPPGPAAGGRSAPGDRGASMWPGSPRRSTSVPPPSRLECDPRGGVPVDEVTPTRTGARIVVAGREVLPRWWTRWSQHRAGLRGHAPAADARGHLLRHRRAIAAEESRPVGGARWEARLATRSGRSSARTSPRCGAPRR
jgi:ABC-type sugar transport system ATPase subunit